MGVPTFPKDICPKVNVIAWLEFELADYIWCVDRSLMGTATTEQNWAVIDYNEVKTLHLQKLQN